MPAEFPAKKIFNFLLIVGLLIGSISLTHMTNERLGEDFFYINFERFKLELSRLRYVYDLYYEENKSVWASLTTTLDLSQKEINVSSATFDRKAKSVPVLLYHGIVQNADGENVTYKNFESQMFALKKAGWETVSLEDFHKFIQGEKDLPDKSFLLTFDDSRKDSFYPVDPILKFLNYRGVNFVITGRSLEGKYKRHPYPLAVWELRDMLKSGRWELQPHGKDAHELFDIDSSGRRAHFLSNKLWKEDEKRLETEEEFRRRITGDLKQSKEDLEKELGVPMYAFAFPFSDFGQDSVNFRESMPIVLETAYANYSLLFYQFWEGIGDTFNYPSPDLRMIRRITIADHWTTEDVLRILENGRSKDLPYHDNFSFNNGWMRTWGTMRLEDRSMIIAGFDQRSGGSVFLDGTYLWKNYKVSAQVTRIKGYSFSILSRYKDDRNYTACIFSPDFVRIEEVIDGRRELLGHWKGNQIPQEVRAGMAVNQNHVECFLNDTPVVASDLKSTSLDKGGISFKSWDPKLDNSEVKISNVSVTGL